MNDKRPVIVLGGDGYSADAIERMLRNRVPASEYEIITHAEAGERGLLQDGPYSAREVRELEQSRIPRKAALFAHRYGTSPANIRRIPNPERDAWNAAVDEQKAAKRRAKGRA